MSETAERFIERAAAFEAQGMLLVADDFRKAASELSRLRERNAELEREITAIEQFAIIHANASQFANARKLWERVRDICRRAIGEPDSARVSPPVSTSCIEEG